MEQKFTEGDHVQIAEDLGPSMAHFTNNSEAIIQYSYRDKYGGGEPTNPPEYQYSIYIKGRGSVAWYYESQLTLIESNRMDLLNEWETAAKEEADIKSDMDWIFSHGEKVLAEGHGATVSTLAKCFGLNNLWGSRGEGITYFTNAHTTMCLAAPFLINGDKDGWIKLCETIKHEQKSTTGV